MKEEHYWQVNCIKTDVFCSGCMSCDGSCIDIGACSFCGEIVDTDNEQACSINYEPFCSPTCIRLYLPEYNETPCNLAEYLATLHYCGMDGCKVITENFELCGHHWHRYPESETENIPF